jgi:hypothetical protein
VATFTLCFHRPRSAYCTFATTFDRTSFRASVTTVFPKVKNGQRAHDDRCSAEAFKREGSGSSGTVLESAAVADFLYDLKRCRS